MPAPASSGASPSGAPLSMGLSCRHQTHPSSCRERRCPAWQRPWVSVPRGLWVWEQHPRNSQVEAQVWPARLGPWPAHTCTAASSTCPSSSAQLSSHSSAPTALPPPADNKGAASLCKTDLPALSSVAELSGLSQPTKPVINRANDRFSFYPHQSNLGNVYSSIVPHTEARGK